MQANILHSDIVIVGGGPVGALAALRLKQAGRDVLLIEARAKDAPLRDARALALSWYSREQLAAAGAWPDSLPATDIDTVHVSQQAAWGRTVISRDDLALPHLGAVVDYPVLAASLGDALQQQGVAVCWQHKVTAVQSLARYASLTVEDAAGQRRQLTARLVVLAEGGALAETLPGIRRHVHDYQQSALLAEVTASLPHEHIAYERFADDGPFALLPHGKGMMLVWTRTPAEAQRLHDADEATVLAELQQAFGERLGSFRAIGARTVFPLLLRQLNRVVSGRVVMIGNAAQTMHPVAAQGFNLGLRDAVGLTELVAAAADPGDAAVLRRYAAQRRMDSHAVVGFTHGLIRLFDGAHPLVKTLRGAGMNMLDSLPPLRKRFAGHLVFGV
ncbi:FAD-dependent monooxygenase [Vogesella sp. GCM10023246]|uniref:FAD-dependent monooxygenase n=1 Tax=Vogesella oryzagri TaxID=3160864 RepID=A0ABV1M3Y5_9NEIS